ncbi:MAG: flavodoxin domain-containing protein [Pirellulaceae bacterium]
MRAIVIYATSEGQTEQIARRIADTMSQSGVPTDTFDITQTNVEGVNVDSYQAVVLGSSLHFGQHDPRIANCIEENQRFLKMIPTAFFSVSLGIVSEHAKDRHEAEWLATEFLQQQRFEPSMKISLAGALRYSRYGWLTKHLMHWIAKKSGQETDTHHDYEYTDWAAVEDFAARFARHVKSTCESKPILS